MIYRGTPIYETPPCCNSRFSRSAGWEHPKRSLGWSPRKTTPTRLNYPLTYKKLRKLSIFHGKIHYKCWFSIVMLVYQRVTSFVSGYFGCWCHQPKKMISQTQHFHNFHEKKHLLHFHGVEIASFGDDAMPAAVPSWSFLSARTIGFVQTPLAVLMTIGPFSNIPAGGHGAGWPLRNSTVATGTPLETRI